MRPTCLRLKTRFHKSDWVNILLVYVFWVTEDKLGFYAVQSWSWFMQFYAVLQLLIFLDYRLSKLTQFMWFCHNIELWIHLAQEPKLWINVSTSASPVCWCAVNLQPPDHYQLMTNPRLKTCINIFQSCWACKLMIYHINTTSYKYIDIVQH